MIDFTHAIECDLGNVFRGESFRGRIGGTSEQEVFLAKPNGDKIVSWFVDKDGNPTFRYMPASFTVRNKKTNKQKAIAAVTVIVENNRFHAYQGAHSRAQQIIEALIKENLLKDDNT